MNTGTPYTLAIEQLDCAAESSLHGVSVREFSRCGYRISQAVLADGSAYDTIVTGKIWLAGEEERTLCRTVLRSVLGEYAERAGFRTDCGTALFCGLGNEQLSADALGSMIFGQLYISGGDPVFQAAGLPALYAVKPGVPGQTGIGTEEHIRLLAEHIGADLIITADAAAARTEKRLASVIQVTDRGVVPGSGASGSGGGEISGKTMPCPVISVSVPTVIRASVLVNDRIGRHGTPDAAGVGDDLLVSNSETDAVCRCYAEIIGGALNRMFAPSLFL